MQLSPVAPPRPPSWKAAGIEFDRGEPDTEFFPGKDVIVFAVVSGISEEAVEVKVRRGLPHGRREVRRILAGASPESDSGNQVGVGVADGGQLGPTRMGGRLIALSSARVVPTDMTSLESRRINGAFGFAVDQAALACAVEDGSHELLKAPFFRSFCSA